MVLGVDDSCVVLRETAVVINDVSDIDSHITAVIHELVNDTDLPMVQRKTGHPNSDICPLFKNDKMSHYLKSAICKHYNLRINHYKKSVVSKRNLNKLNEFRGLMNGMEDSNSPQCYTRNTMNSKKVARFFNNPRSCDQSSIMK